jgi:hypothetical protein
VTMPNTPPSDSTTTGSTTTPDAGPESVTSAPAAEPQGATTTAPQTASQRRSLEDALASLPEQDRAWVLSTVRDARKEAANYRDRARSADEVRNEISTAVAQALGIQPDTTPDPAALTAQLAEQQTAARQAQVELAVFRAATTVGGDPAALLDSRSFLAQIANVDPTDTEAITTRVQAAIAANPLLAGVPARRAPGPNPALGSSANGAPSLDDQILAAKKAGDATLFIHLQNQKLASHFGA